MYVQSAAGAAKVALLLILAGASWTLTSADDEPECVQCIQRTSSKSNCQGAIASGSFTSSKHYHMELSFQANFYKAHQYCMLHGTQLATIQTEEQQQEMEDLMKKHKIDNVWIGVADLADKGRYYYLHNGLFVNYTKWLPDQPDHYDSGERCVEVWYRNSVYGWNDRHCYNQIGIACDLLDTYCP